ncbi:MAG: hypothetical protein MK212_20400 [Saprospiraceae bacterium]|nr:hypothetical protein [Saprospiraceae bacterium]
MPKINLKLTYEGYTFTIVEAVKRRIKQIRITLPQETESTQPA